MSSSCGSGEALFISRWRERMFRDPVETVIARNIADVRPCLAQLEAAVAGGRFAAGFIAYEAAAASYREAYPDLAERFPLRNAVRDAVRDAISAQ